METRAVRTPVARRPTEGHLHVDAIEDHRLLRQLIQVGSEGVLGLVGAELGAQIVDHDVHHIPLRRRRAHLERGARQRREELQQRSPHHGRSSYPPRRRGRADRAGFARVVAVRASSADLKSVLHGIAVTTGTLPAVPAPFRAAPPRLPRSPAVLVRPGTVPCRAGSLAICRAKGAHQAPPHAARPLRQPRAQNCR